MSVDSECDTAEWLDEDTVPGGRGGTTPAAVAASAREVRVLDFKDGRSQVTVSHGPTDPSRVWVALDNATGAGDVPGAVRGTPDRDVDDVVTVLVLGHGHVSRLPPDLGVVAARVEPHPPRPRAGPEGGDVALAVAVEVADRALDRERARLGDDGVRLSVAAARKRRQQAESYGEPGAMPR